MLPTPIISTETLASCAEATQTEAPKTIDANRDRFIIHQIILAPLARTPKIGCCVSSSDRDFYRNAATNDARKVRGTIPGFGQRGFPTASPRIGPQRDDVASAFYRSHL
jgi:hypothetical protein